MRLIKLSVLLWKDIDRTVDKMWVMWTSIEKD